MSLNLIAAMNHKFVIGNNGEIPWKCSKDLKRFKKLTLNHPVIMGRKTYESIGRPLPKRENIILTRNTSFKAEGCHVCHSIDELNQKIETFKTEAFIIGGSEIYNLFLPLANTIYLSVIDDYSEGDAFFPDILKNQEWKIKTCEKHDDHTFLVLKRK